MFVQFCSISFTSLMSNFSFVPIPNFKLIYENSILAILNSNLNPKLNNFQYRSFLWPAPLTLSREYLRGKYHCTIDILFDWFGIRCMTTDNFCRYLQNRRIQTSQTGGQQYSVTSPFSFPCMEYSGYSCLPLNN